MSVLSFQYTAVDRMGKRHKGVTSANDQRDAFRRVTALGMTPIKIVSAKSSSVNNIAKGRTLAVAPRPPARPRSSR